MTDSDSFPQNSEESPQERHEKLSADVDSVLDELDDVLSENSEDFVRSFVMKGGQGWSSLIDPSFFIGATSAGVAAAMTWDAFKLVMRRFLGWVQQVPGPDYGSLLMKDGSLDPDLEIMLRTAWDRASKLSGDTPAEHSLDESQAFHWVLFVREMLKSEGFVKLQSRDFQRIQLVAASTPEQLSPSQLVARIIDQWFRENPNATIGLSRGSQ